jgi:hypothetical protein
MYEHCGKANGKVHIGSDKGIILTFQPFKVIYWAEPGINKSRFGPMLGIRQVWNSVGIIWP